MNGLLDESYARCKELTRAAGTTYYWSTYLLPADQRPHVWALYAFCRLADDIVDDVGPLAPEDRAPMLADLGDRFFTDLASGMSTHPILRAVVHTVRELDIDPECFGRFLTSMTMDLTVTTYPSWTDLLGYMDGSAAVIGEMMLPVLRPDDRAAARRPARDLGLAFQLTNFLRDVDEDLVRGRIYLPQEDLRRFGADPTRRIVDEAWVDLMRFEIDRCRTLYRSADEGLAHLPRSSRRCVGAARSLYSQILDRIEARGYDVFTSRVRVPTWRKVARSARGAIIGR